MNASTVLYAVKSPLRDGFHVRVYETRPADVPKGAEVIRIKRADQCKGAAHLLALFSVALAPPAAPRPAPARRAWLARFVCEHCEFKTGYAPANGTAFECPRCGKETREITLTEWLTQSRGGQ